MIPSCVFLYYNAAAVCGLEAAAPAGDIPRSVEVVVFSNLFVHVPEASKTVRKSDKIARRNADFLSCTSLVY